MIADLKPHSKYKESGVPWLGSLPTHWEIRRAKFLFREMDQRSDTGKEELLSVSHLTGVTPRSQKTITMFLAKSNVGHKICRPNDLVINTMWAWMGALGVTRHTGLVSPAYGVYRPTNRGDILPRFADYLLRTPIYAAEYQRRSTGVNSSRLRLYPENFLRIEVVIPPPNEQADIVRFLDWANGRLDRAIRAKRKVITLLNEQKQAIIHRAVTCGLDPSVPLKPAGIPWLGDIPQHWKAIRIKYLLREVDNRSTTGNEPLLSMRMHHGLVLFSEHFSRPPQAASLVGFKIVKPGQFVVNRMQAGNGVIFASTLDGLVSPDYAVFEPIGDVDVAFLGELFRSRTVRAKFRAESKGLGTGTSGFLRLYNDRFGAIHIALPDTSEQKRIVESLGAELTGVNASIARFEREIALLREYRTRLVADVVTGKLDVREASARLPDTTESEIPAVDEGELDPEEADEEVVA